MPSLKEEVALVFDRAVEWRRDFHAHPEVGNQEARTAAKIAEVLRGLGLEVRGGVAGHGVVALIRGSRPGRTIALRADMDALPIEEATGLAFASENRGVMHACGHDGHCAMLLAAATILAARRSEMAGNVKLVFQPAEELAPRGGAKPMVEAGVLENPKVDAILAIHVFPAMPAGTLHLRKGPAFAAGDALVIDIQGRGGHGAEPHKAVDAVVAACQVVSALQTIVSRNVDPIETGIVTIGKIAGGTAGNVIADTARLEGTVRSFKPEVQDLQEAAVKRVAEGVAGALGASAAVDYRRGYPPVSNDPALCDFLLATWAKALPELAAREMPRPMSVSEDFSQYLAGGVPGALACLGGAIEGREFYPNHHPRFDWDEGTMKVGIAALASAALDYLA